MQNKSAPVAAAAGALGAGIGGSHLTDEPWMHVVLPPLDYDRLLLLLLPLPLPLQLPLLLLATAAAATTTTATAVATTTTTTATAASPLVAAKP